MDAAKQLADKLRKVEIISGSILHKCVVLIDITGSQIH